MLKTRLIPCLDVKAGRVVKGVNFVALRDAGDPVEQARLYDAAGADELCFLDISASVEERAPLLDLVRQTASQCFMPLTVGGGISSVADIRRLLLAGADKVSINSAALARPELLREAALEFGSQCIILAIDAKKNTANEGTDRTSWQVYTHGGRRNTERDALEWAEQGVELGAGEILLTSMDRDGTASGFDLKLTRAISDAVGVPVIASGGVGSLQDLVDGVQIGGASAVLAASIFHFGTFSLAEAKHYMQDHNVAVRI